MVQCMLSGLVRHFLYMMVVFAFALLKPVVLFMAHGWLLIVYTASGWSLQAFAMQSHSILGVCKSVVFFMKLCFALQFIQHVVASLNFLYRSSLPSLLRFVLHELTGSSFGLATHSIYLSSV
ncbi:unnamed protein product [Mucor fragilis]